LLVQEATKEHLGPESDPPTTQLQWTEAHWRFLSRV
jgi:hypothetical protein